MANFNLQMTGAQVKDALNQLINRVAEGWAVGTRDGNPVGSGSPYYQNNAKYYAASAQSSAARAEAAVPASTAGAVFFDRSQSLTDAQKGQAKANIGAGSTNPNLFTNSWFTVDQRGETSGAVVSATYTRDRWKIARANYVFNNDGSVTTTWDGSGAGAFLIQYTPQENYVGLENQTVTVSAYIDGTLRSKTITFDNATGTYNFGGGVTLIYNRHNANGRGIEIQFRHSSTTGLTIAKPKLELGSVSTLANDTPPDPAEELLKCQYYYREVNASDANVALGIAYANSGAVFPNIFGLANGMRTTPSVVAEGAFTIRTSSNVSIAVNSFTAGTSKDAFSIDALVSSGLTTGEVVRLLGSSGAKLKFSADL